MNKVDKDDLYIVLRNYIYDNIKNINPKTEDQVLDFVCELRIELEDEVKDAIDDTYQTYCREHNLFEEEK